MTTRATIERARPLPFVVIDISIGLLVKGSTVNCWNTDKSVRYSALVYCIHAHTYIRAHIHRYIGAHKYTYNKEESIVYSILYIVFE